MMLTDSGHGLAHSARHTGASALGRRRSSSITTTQAERRRVGGLSNEEVPFDVSLCSPLGVPEGVRLLDVLVDLGEAPAVRLLGERVEDLSRVAEGRAGGPGGVASSDLWI